MVPDQPGEGEPAHPDRRRPRRRHRVEQRQHRPGHRPRASLLRGAPRAHQRPGPRRPPLLRRLAGRPRRAAHRRPGLDPQRHAGRRGRARRRRARAAVAVPLAPSRLQRPPAPLPGRGDRRGRRAVPAGHAGAQPRRPPPEVRGHPARRGPDPRHRLRRRHRPVPRPARRPRPRRRPASRWSSPRPTARPRPWHDVQVAIQGPAVHDVETTFRERWEDSTPLTVNPGRLCLELGATARTSPPSRSATRHRLPRRGPTGTTSSRSSGPSRSSCPRGSTSHPRASAR